MDNKVTIDIIPIVLTNKQRNNPTWQLKYKIAKQDLELAQKSILRDLEQNIAVKFNFDIVLTLSISITTFKIKIDYSKIKSKTSVRLIKLYLSRDMDEFAKEWIKLA